ncbi:MAG TPA: TonB-dependent receptor [Burkholderiales bacterium]|nr:TonB-dependent receptor [Burkholderiales bacterium]
MSKLLCLVRRLEHGGRRTLFFAACSTAAALPPIPAAAQLKPPPAKPVVLDEVVVTATRVEESSFGLPVSIDRVDRSVIREDKPQVNLSETLNRVPGIVVQNRQNYAQDLQIQSRGFGARSTFGVRGIRLIADGIPATMPDGQGQAATFSLGSADRIEVLRGPFSSMYGNAAGGVIQIFTADGPPEPTLSGGLFAGSYDTWKAAVQFGGTSGQFNYLGDISRFDTNGYRDHSSARRDQLNAKVKYDAGNRGVLTMVVNSLDQPETQDPLGLTAAQVARNPRQADPVAFTFNTRKSIAQTQLGVTYSLPLTAADVLEARAYAGDRQVTQYLAIPLATQAAATHSGGVVDLDRGYGGAGLRWTHTAELAGTQLIATAGVDYDNQDERRTGFINNNGVTGALKRFEDDTVYDTDFYAQVEWRFAERWTLLAGVRHSRVEFDSKDYFIAPGNPNDSGSVGYVRTTPAAGLTFSLSPAVNLYGNIGRGFETPTFAELAYRSGGASGLNFALRPAVSLNREVGLKSKLGDSMRLNIALFHINVTDEIVVDTNSGGRSTFKNASHTRREGVELAWDGRFKYGFEAAFAYTLLNAQFTEPFTTVISTPSVVRTVNAGNRLPGVPRQTAYGEVVWRYAPVGFHAGVEGRYVSKIYVNDPNTEAAPPYTVWTLRAGFEQRARNWRISEFVRVDNVFGRDYIGSVIVAEANNRFYEPAPTRNHLVGVQASLKF